MKSVQVCTRGEGGDLKLAILLRTYVMDAP